MNNKLKQLQEENYRLIRAIEALREGLNNILQEPNASRVPKERMLANTALEEAYLWEREE